MSENSNKCRYCGEEAHGFGCPYGEDGIHVAIGDEETCIYCGSTSYGSGCAYSNEPNKLGKVHKHGHSTHSPNKCVYCGSTSRGYGCAYSEDGKHHF